MNSTQSSQLTGARRAWPMPLLIKASIVCHGSCVSWTIAWPAHWPWTLVLLIANHLALIAAGLWPRSTLLGPNMVRLPDSAAARGEVALTIDDGPDGEVTPQVLDQLRAAGARATFFCIGSRVAAHPALARRILQEGHSLQNHSEHHTHRFSLMGPRRIAHEIGAAQQTFLHATGRTPCFFRAPAGLRNPFLDPVLHRFGLKLVSWTRRGFDTRESDAAVVLARLTRDLRAGDILLLHDGHAAHSRDGRPVVLSVLPALMQRLAKEGLHAVTLPEALGETPGHELTALDVS